MSKRDKSPKRTRSERKNKCAICLYKAVQIPAGQEPWVVKDSIPSTCCSHCDLRFCEDCLKECFSHDEESIKRRTGERIQYYTCETCQFDWCLSEKAMKIGGGLRNAIEKLSMPTRNLCWTENNDGRPVCLVPGCKAIFCSSDCLSEHSGTCWKCDDPKHLGVCVVCREAPLKVCRECKGEVICGECKSATDN
jgi:hypothetical protein